jgi:hypothetical protein
LAKLEIEPFPSPAPTSISWAISPQGRGEKNIEKNIPSPLGRGQGEGF